MLTTEGNTARQQDDCVGARELHGETDLGLPGWPAGTEPWGGHGESWGLTEIGGAQVRGCRETSAGVPTALPCRCCWWKEPAPFPPYPCNVYILYIHIQIVCDIYARHRARAVEMHALTTGCHSSPPQPRLLGRPGGQAGGPLGRPSAPGGGSLGEPMSPRRELAGCPCPRRPPGMAVVCSPGSRSWSPDIAENQEGCSSHQIYRDWRPHSP